MYISFSRSTIAGIHHYPETGYIYFIYLLISKTQKGKTLMYKNQLLTNLQELYK